MKEFLDMLAKMAMKAAVQSACNEASRSLEEQMKREMGVTIKMHAEVIDIDPDRFTEARGKEAQRKAAQKAGNDELLEGIMKLFDLKVKGVDDDDDDDDEE